MDGNALKSGHDEEHQIMGDPQATAQQKNKQKAFRFKQIVPQTEQKHGQRIP